MRVLTLDEKITMKGELARNGAAKQLLVCLDTWTASYLYWICYGRPMSTFGIVKPWRKKERRRKTQSAP